MNYITNNINNLLFSTILYSPADEIRPNIYLKFFDILFSHDMKG